VITSNKQGAPGWLVLLAFLAIYIVWGTTYLAIIYGLKGFPPFLLSAFRYLIAGTLLAGWCSIRGMKMPSGAIIKTCVISGLLMLIGGSGLVTWSEQYVGSGQAAIIIASEPFWFLLIDKKRWREYFSNWYIISGLIIGFAGIVLFFGFSGSEPGVAANMQWMGYGVIILSAILWVVGSLYAENRQDNSASNILTVCIQLLAGGVGSLLISGVTGEFHRFSFTTVPLTAWAGLLYLVFMGSMVAYMAFTWLITVRPPALVSTYTYINPLIAVLMGWAFVNERFVPLQLLSMIIILAGVLLTNFPSYRHKNLNTFAPEAKSIEK
jgi:drug/metabolite transporter (DMT)-like permease